MVIRLLQARRSPAFRGLFSVGSAYSTVLALKRSPAHAMVAEALVAPAVDRAGRAGAGTVAGGMGQGLAHSGSVAVWLTVVLFGI